MTSSMASSGKAVTVSRRRQAQRTEGDLQRQRARATFLSAPRQATPVAKAQPGVELLGDALAALIGRAPTLRG